MIDKIKKVILYYQDESRYGQKTITSGIWSLCGICPEYKNQNGFLILKYFSRKIKINQHVLLAHSNNKIIIPKHLALQFLPPYSPQLNPIERLQSYLKRNYLSFRIYEKIDDIIQSSSGSWNQLTDEIVKSI